jgi:hypothetical protein
VTVAIDPIRAAFAELWPAAEIVNLLDDSLSIDRARDADLTAAMQQRIAALGAYAVSLRAQGVLYTCSAFGAAIEAFARAAPVPVLKPNEAMFEEALGCGPRIGMLATFAPSVASMDSEFAEAAARRGVDARVDTILVEQAMAALRGGDENGHNRLLAQAATRFDSPDAIMLAHFSTSRARHAVSEAVTCPVLTAPHSAVLSMQQRCRR